MGRRRRKMLAVRDWSPRRGRARVLVENADGAEQWVLASKLAQDGYDVAVCDGPDFFKGVDCPLVERGHCPLAEGADVVVNGFRLSQTEHREVISALREQLPDLPVIVEVRSRQAAQYADVLQGCRAQVYPMTAATVRAAVAAEVSA